MGTYDDAERFTLESFRIMQGIIQSNRGFSKLFRDRMQGMISTPPFDPFEVLSQGDEATLRSKLSKLNIVDIFSIIYSYDLAPAGISATEKSKSVIVDHAVRMIKS